jgi:methyl-accepting chemotaxis protein
MDRFPPGACRRDNLSLGWKYYIKAGVSLAFVGLLQITGMIYYFKLVMDLPPDIFVELRNVVIPLGAILLLIFAVVCIFLITDLLAFINASPEDHSYSDEDLIRIQARIINVSYKLAAVSVGFYIVIVPGLTFLVGVKMLDLSYKLMIYGSLGGFIAGVLNVPLTIYIANIVTAPAIDYTFEFSSTLPRAARRGVSLGVRSKLMIAMLSLIMTTLVYTVIISYTQAKMIIGSGKAIEAELIRRGGHVDTSLKTEDGHNVQSMSHYESRMGGMWIFYVAVLLVCAALALFITSLAANEISRPVRQMAERIQVLIEGDYDQEVTMVGNDELAYLAEVYNLMLAKIKEQVSSVQAMSRRIERAVQQVNETSKAILAVSEEQSRGSSDQAAAMHQTSAISAQIVSTAKQIGSRAGQMDEAAATTLLACGEGQDKLISAVKGYDNFRDQVLELSDFLNELNQHYLEMFKIVDTIDYIAEQTELLALNASLEAAGAGEAGSRFGVVASATKRLSTSASESTSEIRSLISDLQKSTSQAAEMSNQGAGIADQGKIMIDEVSRALEDISEKARSTSASVSEITQSTTQQTKASEQMEESVNDVYQVAQNMLDGAKEIESSIAELSKLAEELQQMVES